MQCNENGYTGGNPRNFVIQTYTKKGVPAWLNVSTISIEGSKPELNTVIHMFRDITKQKKDLNIIIDIASKMKDTYNPEINSLSDGTYATQRRLTSREKMVLKYLGEGLRPKDISDKMYVSLPTIRKHIQNIYSKLQVNSMLEAVIKARQENLF